MPRRDDDDEDYLPRRPRGREAGGGGSGLALWAGLALGAVVVGALMFFVLRGRNERQARVAAEVARAELARAAAEFDARSPGGATWPRMIGTWNRVPRGAGDTDYPYRFEFRDDLTAATTRLGSGGHPVRYESRVEILSDQGDTVRLRLRVNAGMYSYTFTLRPDGGLVLDDGRGGLVFMRAG